MYKIEYYDTLFGLLLAFIIGGAIAYFRIDKYKLFSPSEYEKNAVESKDSN
jgi:Na+/glutamate symporter